MSVVLAEPTETPAVVVDVAGDVREPVRRHVHAPAFDAAIEGRTASVDSLGGGHGECEGRRG
jgi:hypothetical protein